MEASRLLQILTFSLLPTLETPRTPSPLHAPFPQPASNPKWRWHIVLYGDSSMLFDESIANIFQRLKCQKLQLYKYSQHVPNFGETSQGCTARKLFVLL